MDYSPILFTPSALLDFLIQIDELKDKVVSVTETADGDLQVEIGDSAYIVKRIAQRTLTLSSKQPIK